MPSDRRLARPLQPPDPLPAARRGGPAQAHGQPGHALRLRGARHRAGQPPGPRRASGRVRIVDRDFIETHNLQRQILFDEHDVADNLPKAEAAARKLRPINSDVTIEPVVTDIDHTNILDLVGDADLILDGTDNFETRYLINDAAVKLGKPWIFGGVIGSEGQTMTILPGKTPCLRCLIEDSPPPGMTPTCETAGVLGPAVAVIASFEAVEAIKLLSGALRRAQQRADHGRRLGLDLPPAQGRRPAGQGRLPVLPAAASSSGSTARSARTRRPSAAATPSRSPPDAPSRLNFPELARRLAPLGEVRHNAFMLRFATEGYEFTVFPDGRAIIKGTNDIAKARTLYAQFVGS